MGELGLTYSLAPIVLVGGSLIEHGGQSIEPIKLGAAVLHGPHVANFAEIYAALDAARGAAEITNIDQLIQRIGNWLQDPMPAIRSDAGQKTVERLGGALDRTAAALEPYLLQVRLERRVADA